MFVELQKGATQAVRFAPDELPSACTLRLVPPDTETPVWEGAATPVALDTTVSAVGSTPDVITLASVTGVLVWDELWYTSQVGWSSKVRVASCNTVSKEVGLLTGPPGSPAVGDRVRGLMLSATIPSTALTKRGTHWRLWWDCTIGGESRRYLQMAAVVAQRFREPATSDEARAIAAELSPGFAKAKGFGFWRDLAEAASADVRRELQSLEDYPHLQGNHDAFRAAGEVALRLRLIPSGIVPKDLDPDRYRDSLVAELPTIVRKVVAGSWRDTAEDNKVNAGQILGVQNMRIVRA